jgi:hypothetical protein
MTRFTTKQLYDIAEWCQERQMLPDRITGGDVSAACNELGIPHDNDFDLYEVKEIGTLYKVD